VPLLTKSYSDAVAQAAKVEQALSLTMAGLNFAIVTSKQHVNAVRLVLNPDAIICDEEVEGSLKFKLHNVCFDTSRQHLSGALASLGWTGAQAVRTLGADTWLVFAESQPPSRALILRTSTAQCKIMVTEIMPTAKFTSLPAPVTISAPAPAASSWSAPAEHPRPVAAKLEQVRGEMKGELLSDIKAQLQSEITDLIDAKITAANEKQAAAQAETNNKLDQAVQSIQAQVQTTAGIAQQAADVAKQAIDSSSTLTSSLQAMMHAQQDAIMKQMKSLLDAENNERKSRRTDGADALTQSRNASPST
jgi:hypothetical protein